MKDIEELAKKFSLYVIDIKAAGVEEDGALKKYQANLNCEAEMEQLVKFFYNVENSDKLFKIEKYDLKPKTKRSSVVRSVIVISKTVLP